MKNFLLHGFLVVFLLWSSAAMAAPELRVAEHGDYTRLVIQWDKKATFELQKSKEPDASYELVTVSFDQKADPPLAPLKDLLKGNVLTLDVMAQDPVKLSFAKPASSDLRTLSLGNRVILDIYKPTDSQELEKARTQLAEKKKEEPPAEKPKEKAPETAEKESPMPEPEMTLEEKPEIANKPAPEPAAAPETKDHEVIHDIQEPPALKGPNEQTPPTKSETPAEESPEEESKEEVHEAVEQEKEPMPPDLEAPEEKAPADDHEENHEEEGDSTALDGEEHTAASQDIHNVEVRPSLVTMSAARPTGLAVFQLGDKIWLINDVEDLLFTPQITGPETDKLMPLESTAIEGGRSFQFTALPNRYIKVQGGGLLWRIIIAQEKPQEEPVKLIRRGVQERLLRSGKIVYPFQTATRVIKFREPESGLDLFVVPLGSAGEFAGPGRDFVDFTVLPSAAGIAIVPKVDDLTVVKTSVGIEISRESGLVLSPEGTIKQVLDYKKARSNEAIQKSEQDRVFDFKNWQLGGLASLQENVSLIFDEFGNLEEGAQTEALLTLARMFLANGFGPEALGYLHMAAERIPQLEENPEFMGMIGAAKALDMKSEIAFSDLSKDPLKPYEEIAFWRSYVLADLGDWQQAAAILPEDIHTVYSYPDEVFNKIALVLAEVLLRDGKVEKAEKLLQTVEKTTSYLFLPQRSALRYLRGEAARQRGDLNQTKKLWKPLTTGQDDLYRAKAGLALTRLLVDEGEMSPAEAIDNLERLRFAWRGDLLEAQISYWLGRTYFENGEFGKGLNIMREASSFAGNTAMSARIIDDMNTMFTTLFVGPNLEKVSPLDAATLYDQFQELLPPGEVGSEVIRRLAEHLIKADLLNKSAEFFEYLIDRRLENVEDKYEATARVSAIHLLDNKPMLALASLDRAKGFFEALPETAKTEDRIIEQALLRARSLSQNGRPDHAIVLLDDLEKKPDVNRLRADIAWNAGYWDDAADALNDVILDSNISLTRPLEDEQATLIIQRAVALNLANDRIALANLRERYTQLMSQTKQAKIFEIITKPRHDASLADRDTMLSIASEVDLFSEFLNNYREIKNPLN